ncbi:hypothetical protein [Phreatobacter oligotrophus]|uniref:Uncharacterized protein n=1 Tax=Phreatobacter oligotrophus TaxID=1122261 RepID=A0A2T4ZIS3_9HYPH|nr:hypothetical protein [Phreatobacter oligotrophus]PTM61879.1 hypothetical protein C8P69_101551 [Phreatobacter oligotrophus]
MPRTTVFAAILFSSAAWLAALVWFAGDARATCERHASTATCVTLLR